MNALIAWLSALLVAVLAYTQVDSAEQLKILACVALFIAVAYGLDSRSRLLALEDALSRRDPVASTLIARDTAWASSQFPEADSRFALEPATRFHKFVRPRGKRREVV